MHADATRWASAATLSGRPHTHSTRCVTSPPAPGALGYGARGYACSWGWGAGAHACGRACARGVGSVACVGRRCGGGGSGSGAEAADRGEEAVDTAGFVAGEEHLHVRVPFLAISGPRHLALPAVHELVAAGKGLARPRVEHLLAHRIAARQRLRPRAESLGVGVARGGCQGRWLASGMRVYAAGLRRVAPIGVKSQRLRLQPPRGQPPMIRSQRVSVWREPCACGEVWLKRG